MKLLSIRTARFVGLIETAELNPRGLSVYPSLIDGLVEKYNFEIFPDEENELDETKGIVFENGVWGKNAIDKVAIHSEFIIVETRSSTKDSEAIFNEALQWAADTIGITYAPDMVSQRGYVSELNVRCNSNLSKLNDKLTQFGESVSSALLEHTGKKAKYETTGITLHYDTAQIKNFVAPFKIERLLDSSFSANKYYSVAPLPTEEHLRLLEEFEEILK